jgi:hypothetical protein
MLQDYYRNLLDNIDVIEHYHMEKNDSSIEIIQI